MMLQTGSCHCFLFLSLLFSLHLSPTLASFQKGCTVLYFDKVTAGVSVDCGDSDLDRVPDNIPRDVVSLSLLGNKIQKVHKRDFYYLSNLTDLDLSGNSISHVDDRSFVNLLQLKVLLMYQNELTKLTDNMFQGLSNLLILYLEPNDIQFFNPAAFQSLTSLQELSMWPNTMTDIITVLQLPSLEVLRFGYFIKSFQSKDEGGGGALHEEQGVPTVLDLPLGFISQVQKMGGQKTSGKEHYGLEIVCKDIRTLR